MIAYLIGKIRFKRYFMVLWLSKQSFKGVPLEEVETPAFLILNGGLPKLGNDKPFRNKKW